MRRGRVGTVSTHFHDDEIMVSENIFDGPRSEMDNQEIEITRGKILRFVLNSSQPVVHQNLRTKIVSKLNGNSKYVFEIALFTLIEHGLLIRHGFGNFSTKYTIPSETWHMASSIAYAEFPSQEDTSSSDKTTTNTPFSMKHQPSASPCQISTLQKTSRPTSRQKSLNSILRTQNSGRKRSAPSGFFTTSPLSSSFGHAHSYSTNNNSLLEFKRARRSSSHHLANNLANSITTNNTAPVANSGRSFSPNDMSRCYVPMSP